MDHHTVAAKAKAFSDIAAEFLCTVENACYGIKFFNHTDWLENWVPAHQGSVCLCELQSVNDLATDFENG